jgi:hypothetical protein
LAFAAYERGVSVFPHGAGLDLAASGTELVLAGHHTASLASRTTQLELLHESTLVLYEREPALVLDGS